MYQRYSHLGTRMNKWDKYLMAFERGYAKHRRLLYLFQIFNTRNLFNGFPSKNKHFPDKGLYEKFIKKHSHLLRVGNTQKLTQLGIAQRAMAFIRLQKEFMRKGYEEEKAFELAEKDFSLTANKGKVEAQVLCDYALSNHARGLLSYAEQNAEFEARQKAVRLKRDIPKYLREKSRWLAGIENKTEEEIKEILAREDAFSLTEHNLHRGYYSIEPNEYSPGTYALVKNRKALEKHESLFSNVQKSFKDDVNFVLRIHQERAALADGIAALNDPQIILKIRDAPTRVKRRTKQLLNKLEKLGVILDENGNVDFSNVESKKDLKELKDNETLIKVALMEKDLDFEYPHKLKNLLKPIERPAELPERPRPALTYEEYYGIDPKNEVELADAYHRWNIMSKNKVKFEEYAKKMTKSLIFDNDLLEISYQFWESIEERAQRLETLWQELKKNKQSKEVTEGQLYEAINQAIEKLRSTRWKFDKLLEKEGIDPIFKEHYLTYTREEFLFGSDVNYHKIMMMASRAPKRLKEDPEVGPYFDQILNLLKKVKVPENTSPGFYDTEGIYNWDTEEKKKMKKITNLDELKSEPMEVEEYAEFAETMMDPKNELNTDPKFLEEQKKMKLISELKTLIEEDLESKEKKGKKSKADKKKNKAESTAAKNGSKAGNKGK